MMFSAKSLRHRNKPPVHDDNVVKRLLSVRLNVYCEVKWRLRRLYTCSLACVLMSSEKQFA